MGALGRASCGVRREAPPRAKRAMRQTRASRCMPFMLWLRWVGGHPFRESSRWPWPFEAVDFGRDSQCGGIYNAGFAEDPQCNGLWRVPPRAKRAMRQTRASRRRSRCMPFMLWLRWVGGHPFGESSRWPWPFEAVDFGRDSQCGVCGGFRPGLTSERPLLSWKAEHFGRSTRSRQEPCEESDRRN
jgi:hypothetical protein